MKTPVPTTLLKKETLAQVFSCEISEIFKNTYFYRTPPVTASAHYQILFKCDSGNRS